MSTNGLINEEGYKTIWCPVCQLVKQPCEETVAVWVTPASVHVGNYTICQECMNETLKMDKTAGSNRMDLIEQRLIHRYPALLKKLPVGYSQGGHPGKN